LHTHAAFSSTFVIDMATVQLIGSDRQNLRSRTCAVDSCP